jgi:ribosomal protein S18 acetylase RimI-like enzyme
MKMILLRRITDSNDLVLCDLLLLYIQTFPDEERRNMEELHDLIEREPRMHFNSIEKKDELCGLLVYWDFSSFKYLEHLAVYPTKRNCKIGQQALQYMAKHFKGPRILEVEPVADEVTMRRINYYKRNGYEVLDREYTQPPYPGKEGKGLSLWIMGNPEAIQPHMLKEYIKTIKKEVYSWEGD